jgi:hypothetical protein
MGKEKTQYVIESVSTMALATDTFFSLIAQRITIALAFAAMIILLTAICSIFKRRGQWFKAENDSLQGALSVLYVVFFAAWVYASSSEKYIVLQIISMLGLLSVCSYQMVKTYKANFESPKE